MLKDSRNPSISDLLVENTDENNEGTVVEGTLDGESKTASHLNICPQFSLSPLCELSPTLSVQVTCSNLRRFPSP